MELRQTRWQILGSLVIVIAAFDVVLWQNNHPGSAVALIYGVLLLALLPKQWDYASRAIVCGQWVISGLLLLSLLIQPGFLNVLLAGLSLFVYRLMLEGVPGTWVKLARRVLFWGCFGWIVEWFFLLFSPVKSEDGVLKKGLVRALLLWVLPLIFSLVFIAFLCDGNPIFAKYCRQVLSWIRFPDVERIFFWFLLLLMLSPLFSLRFYRILFDKSDAAYVAPTPLELPPGSFFFESMYRGLFLFNALFLINNIIDIAFLWSGRALPEGVSYAEYAHRSAYPLIVTVLLAGALVMVAFGNAKQLKQYKYIKFLIVFWLAQNVFLVFSSMLRLKKYVDAYSLTEWRMAAWIWMLLVALGLGLLIYRICRDWTNRKFLIANALTWLGVLLLASAVNLQYFIAEYNLAHCRETTDEQQNTKLDVKYLYSLGFSAYPALIKAEKRGILLLKSDSMEFKVSQFVIESANWRSWSIEKYVIYHQIRGAEK